MSPEQLLPLICSLERELHDPAVRQDARRLDELLHPQFMEIGRSGRAYGRDEALAQMRVGEAAPRIEASDFALRVLGQAVLLTYKSTQHGGAIGVGVHTLRSSIWLLGPAGWQVIFHQGTPAGRDPGAAA